MIGKFIKIILYNIHNFSIKIDKFYETLILNQNQREHLFPTGLLPLSHTRHPP
mgnify:FL=1